MSRLMIISKENALFIGTSFFVSAGIAFNTLKFIKRIYDDWQPNRWCKVGYLSELWCFPIKSCGPIAISEIDCGQIGLQLGNIRDRVFCVTHDNGEFITARTYPRMVLIRPVINKDIMKISAPGMEDIEICFTELLAKDKFSTVEAKIWKDKISSIDCGEEAGRWMSKYILNKPDGLRLVFYPTNDPRTEVNDRGYLFKQAEDEDTGAFHDETSYMLMNEASFDDLNKKLIKNNIIDTPVTPLQYRPNFVVKTTTAWEEDDWKWIKIGNSTIFKVNQPCIRCVLTNINPLTGERHPDMQPLKTLKEFRVFQNIANSPYFGVHLGLRQKGIVKLGDDVFVSL